MGIWKGKAEPLYYMIDVATALIVCIRNIYKTEDTLSSIIIYILDVENL